MDNKQVVGALSVLVIVVVVDIGWCLLEGFDEESEHAPSPAAACVDAPREVELLVGFVDATADGVVCERTPCTVRELPLLVLDAGTMALGVARTALYEPVLGQPATALASWTMDGSDVVLARWTPPGPREDAYEASPPSPAGWSSSGRSRSSACAASRRGPTPRTGRR